VLIIIKTNTFEICSINCK